MTLGVELVYCLLLSNPKFVDQFQFRTLEALGEEVEDEMENSTYEEMDFEIPCSSS